MLARGALSRLAAEVPKQAAHDLPKLATLVQTARRSFALPLRTLTHVTQLQTRSYATAKTESDPAAPVKKAVKARAAAGKNVTKTTKKKAAPKKAKKKAAAPKRAKKKAAAPKKAAKKPRKVLSDEEKQKAHIKKLREVALKEPVSRNKLIAFHVYVAEKTTGSKGDNKATLAETAASFKNISPAEREKYNHLAAERNEARLAEYQAWVKSYTPDQIRLANNARKLLKRKLAGTFKGAISHTQPIEDDRQVKRAVSPFAFFFAERQVSSDFTGIALAERTRLIAAEWKALSAGEKQRFDDLAAADKQRHAREAAAFAKA